MKRSRINQVIKDMERLIKEHGFGILRTLALASSMRSDSRYLRSVTATRRCRRNIRRFMRRSF